MSSPQLDDAAIAAKRKQTRARARIILRIAATAMRGVQEMQSKVDKKQDEIKQMRAAAARGGPNSPTKSDQIAAVKELVALQREQKRAAKTLTPRTASGKPKPSTPPATSKANASPSNSPVSPQNLDSQLDAAQDKLAKHMAEKRRIAGLDKEIESLREALTSAQARAAAEKADLQAAMESAALEAAAAMDRMQERHTAELQQLKADNAAEVQQLKADNAAEVQQLKADNAAEVQQLKADIETRKSSEEKAKVGEAALRTLNASTMQRLAAMKETAENAKAELASAESKHAETLAAEIEKTVQKMEAEKNAAVSQERATVFQNVQQAIAALQTQ